MALPLSIDRVRMNMSEEDVDEKVLWDIECRLHYFKDHPEEIGARLASLDAEWDLERVLHANAAAIGLGGLLLSFARRRYVILPLAVMGFLIQHALQGWCLPVPLLRRLGFRTCDEIEMERCALHSLADDLAARGPSTEQHVDDAMSESADRMVDVREGEGFERGRLTRA
jgi:hypothetical protein